jgi:hypothetical protein
MEEEQLCDLVANINKDIDESLYEIITKYLVNDDKYCEELDICLTRVKDKNGKIIQHIFPIMNGKRFVNMSIDERLLWFKFNYHNSGRGFIIKTFTYYWLHNLCLKSQEGFIDMGWQNSLNLYFDDKNI